MKTIVGRGKLWPLHISPVLGFELGFGFEIGFDLDLGSEVVLNWIRARLL